MFFKYCFFKKEFFIRKASFLIAVLIFTIFLSLTYYAKRIEYKILDKTEYQKKKLGNLELNNKIFELLKANDISIFTDYFYLKYILNREEYEKYKICYYFHKENFNHCKFKIKKNDLIINVYSDDQLLLNTLKKQSLNNFEIVSNNKKFRIYKKND